jgi:hypothetical protein
LTTSPKIFLSYRIFFGNLWERTIYNLYLFDTFPGNYGVLVNAQNLFCNDGLSWRSYDNSISVVLRNSL